MPNALHLNLDNAWSGQRLPFETVDLTSWGPQLRFSAPAGLIEQFYSEVKERLPRFVLYGSGDFHHLTALWLRRLQQPLKLISFDNHPDWDIRPPRWCCGGWVNRALEMPQVEKVSVWGCGNFEYWWPGRLFGNRRAERAGRLEIYRWTDNRSASDQERKGAILRSTWREHFIAAARALSGSNLYVTIDLDSLCDADAITNWESGLFTTQDVAWALRELRNAGGSIVGGDVCGAFSPPRYARRKQRFVSEMDHPRLSQREAGEAQKINLATFEKLWPLLAE